MLEIVLVEMEATQEVVGGLGKWAPCQKVSEELGYPAGHRGRLLYLQKGDLLLVCTVKRGGSGVSFRKRYPWAFTPASVDSQRPESPLFPTYSPLAAPPHPYKAPTQAGLVLCPAVPELAGLRGPVQAVLEVGCIQVAPDT